MNKINVFFSDNSSLAYEYANYVCQICGPAKLLPLKDIDTDNFANISEHIIFCLNIFVAKNNNFNNHNQLDNYNDSEKSIFEKMIINLGESFFCKDDIENFEKIINYTYLKPNIEYYFIFLLKYDEDNFNREKYLNINLFCNVLNLIKDNLNGFIILDSTERNTLEYFIEYLRKLRIQTLSPKRVMNQLDLASSILNFILEHDVCIISTGYKENIRATVVEYLFKNFKFYIISEAGEKYANLICNKNVALTIYDSLTQGGRIKSIQVSGTAKIYSSKDEEIKVILESRGLNKDTISSLNFEIYVIEIVPKSIELYDPDLKKLGYSSKQVFNPINFFNM